MRFVCRIGITSGSADGLWCGPGKAVVAAGDQSNVIDIRCAGSLSPGHCKVAVIESNGCNVTAGYARGRESNRGAPGSPTICAVAGKNGRDRTDCFCRNCGD